MGDTLHTGPPDVTFDLPLAEALDFTLGDLRANREGYLSKRQRELLPRKIRQESIGRFVSFMPLAFLASGGFHLVMAVEPDSQHDETLTALLMMIAIGIPAWFVVIESVLGFILAISDLHRGLVCTRIGDARLREPWWIHNTHQLRVGKLLRSFRLTRALYLTFRPREGYRIYYLPYSRVIISAEPLHEIRRAWRPMAPVEKP